MRPGPLPLVHGTYASLPFHNEHEAGPGHSTCELLSEYEFYRLFGRGIVDVDYVITRCRCGQLMKG